ncbi:hypothetical protein GCM10011360_17840 [Primorskyibacter flagellatus]|uniref:DUF1351 domain-containing protein n=1 Tax=Primorskyibacter flagellatus TaxID=1387277 RepID=A0A917EFV7_9RHOB|nr:hypothetical protein [Primorskyibacter flagellatus]GGE30213.1 hypothetical protein GCM10011360_17840 [Primorskyibacter flagellatus]
MTTTDIIEIDIPHKTDVPALFETKDGVPNLVAKIEKQARSFAIDYTTEAGRKEAKSLAAKVSRSKTLIDEVGKEQNEERNRLNKEVNALRNLATSRLDALRDEIKAPVVEWEKKEAERVRLHMLAMDAFDLGRVSSNNSSIDIQGVINSIRDTKIDETWEEYEADAKAAKAEALVKFQADLGIARQREDQEKELEALRAEKAKREAEDAERAEKEASEKAEQERKAEAERQSKEAAAAAEAKAKADAEAAERRHKEELAAAQRRADEAAAAERAQIEAEKKAEAEAEEKRRSDKLHRMQITTEIVVAMKALKPEGYEDIVDAMIDGKIPHVKVSL